MADNDQNALAQGQTFVWHELYTSNVGGAVDFYAQVADFGTQEMDMGEMGTYKMFTRGGTPVAGMMDTAVLDMPGVPPHWSTFISVNDVDAKAAKAVELGGSIVVPAMDVPTVGRMTLIADPQGAHVWLFKGE